MRLAERLKKTFKALYKHSVQKPKFVQQPTARIRKQQCRKISDCWKMWERDGKAQEK